MKRTIVLELEDLQIDSIKRESELAQSSAKEISNVLGPIVVDAFTRYVKAKTSVGTSPVAIFGTMISTSGNVASECPS